MLRFIFALVAVLVLYGCASTPDEAGDGYQPFDITKRALMLRAEYCANADPERRSYRLAILRAAGVPVPPSGACGDILRRALDEGWIPSVDVDVEQAREDQRRFQGESDQDAD